MIDQGKGEKLSTYTPRTSIREKARSTRIVQVRSMSCVLAIAILAPTAPAAAIPPPPPEPPRLRTASMTATVKLIEAANGRVSKITELCKVSGRIPVYSDDGGAARIHGASIPGCSMSRNGENLTVQIHGAKAISKGQLSYAFASVVVTPSDAKPLCPDVCGPQPLADSAAEVRVSGTQKSMAFSLNVNVVSVLNARPAVWLDAAVEIVD